MRHFRNRLGLLCLLSLLLSVNLAAAQDAGDISVVGSSIMSELLRSLGEAANIGSLNMTAQGTSKGIDRFCNGDIDIAVASRAISSAEDAICHANEVANSEFLLAHKIVAFAAHKAVPLSCISRSNLESLLKPSSSNQAADWSDYAADTAALPIVMFVPHESSLEYALVDGNVIGDRLRGDVERYDLADDALATTGETEGALAILPFGSDLAGNDSIQVLETDSTDVAGCVSPSALSVEAGLYPFSQTYYLYVNRTRLAHNELLKNFVQVMISPDAADALTKLGFTPPTSEIYRVNETTLTDPDSSLALGGGETEFEIPEELSGEIDISGAANGYQLLERVSSRMPGEGARLQISIEAFGQRAGVADLCAGGVDIAILDSLPRTLDMGACEGNEIVTVSIAIGNHATVLLGNAADQYTQCLTIEQLDEIWNASSTDTIMAWNEINEAMPQQSMILFGLSSVDRYADILLQGIHDALPPIRRDTEQNFDPLYRAAAVANVEGSLTYMSWPDYQKVLGNQQSNVHLVSVDAGSGCVSPSADTIANGMYPLTRPASLLANELSLTDINVQSLLWSLFSDDNWALLEREQFVGIKRADLPARRRQLETLFRQAEAMAPPIDDASEPVDGGEATEDTSE